MVVGSKTLPMPEHDGTLLTRMAAVPAWVFPLSLLVVYALIYLGVSAGILPAQWLALIRDHATGLFR